MLPSKKDYHENDRPNEQWFILQREAEAWESKRRRVLRRKPVLQSWMIPAMTRKGLL